MPVKKSFRLLPSILLFLFFCINIKNVRAQLNLKEIGNVKTVKISGQNVSITTDVAFIEAMVYSPSIIRIRMDKQVLKKDFSYAVITDPMQTKATITQTAIDITIVTDSLKAVFTKKPYAVTFYNNEGIVVSEDEKGLTTSWVNEEVT
ncbi:MAG: DUF4968 domain-containing protein, partial [Ferruginibacter sp.]|nr:DUF4968 domain-containing protein [Ferruginibacter sp.]